MAGVNEQIRRFGVFFAEGLLQHTVDRVTGPYDVILVFEADDLRTVGERVTEHVHTISGIVRTVTCLAVS